MTLIPYSIGVRGDIMKNTLLGVLAVVVVVIVAVVVNFIPRGYKEVDAPGEKQLIQ